MENFGSLALAMWLFFMGLLSSVIFEGLWHNHPKDLIYVVTTTFFVCSLVLVVFNGAQIVYVLTLNLNFSFGISFLFVTLFLLIAYKASSVALFFQRRK